MNNNNNKKMVDCGYLSLGQVFKGNLWNKANSPSMSPFGTHLLRLNKVEKQLLGRQTCGQMGEKRAVKRTPAECKHKRIQCLQLIWLAHFFKLHLDARQAGG